MIWRMIKVVLAALLVFVVVNFLVSNLDPQVPQNLGYAIHFQFKIPPFVSLESAAFPVWILILSAFCLGMIFAAFMGAISVFHRSRELKAKNRTIHELEREIEELRALYSAQRLTAPLHPQQARQEDSDEPRIE